MFFQRKCNQGSVVFVFIYFPVGLNYLEEIKFNRCIYIEDTCLERLSSIENLQESLHILKVGSCGNVTDKGIISLHRLRWADFYSCGFVKKMCSYKTDFVVNKDRCLNSLINFVLILLRNLGYLFLSDLPGIIDTHKTIERLQTALPRLDIRLDLDWETTSCITYLLLPFFVYFQNKTPSRKRNVPM